jgi:hypothetical protein
MESNVDTLLIVVVMSMMPEISAFSVFLCSGPEVDMYVQYSFYSAIINLTRLLAKIRIIAMRNGETLRQLGVSCLHSL